MDIPSTQFCQQLRLARRAKGLTQAELAQRVGCQQSAISMMEAGRTTALARETVAKVAAELGLALELAGQAVAPTAARMAGQAHCPDPECPSNVPFVVSGTLLFWPRPQPSAGGSHCAWCGEVLARACPACGAPAVAGACCLCCGTPYVPPPVARDSDSARWAAERRRQLSELRTLLATDPVTQATGE